MSEEPSYTFDEARALIPQVRAVLLQLAIEKRRFDEALTALHAEHAAHAAAGADGSHVDVEQREAALAQVGEGIKGLLALLESLGVQVRDLDSGLVDIPTRRDGAPVWLCWRLSDADLAFWHSTSEGFANRKPW
jgi:hypothetical protein